MQTYKLTKNKQNQSSKHFINQPKQKTTLKKRAKKKFDNHRCNKTQNKIDKLILSQQEKRQTKWRNEHLHKKNPGSNKDMLQKMS